MAFDVGKTNQGFCGEIEQLKHENVALAKKLGKTRIETAWSLSNSKNTALATEGFKERYGTPEILNSAHGLPANQPPTPVRGKHLKEQQGLFD